ncbi:MAG: peptidoglycan DD-metalloendopeptidase family protein [Chloroflexi bacterium]|nr:peptidoglycan DD-metalloendopeptidase family protein [Chloroflexota bacterium]
MSPRRLAGLALLALCGALLASACFIDGTGVGPSPDEPPAAAEAQPAASAESAPRQGTAAGLAPEARGDPAETGSAPAADASPQPEAQPAQEPSPAPALRAAIFVEPREVRPGQVFIVAVDATNASAASVALGGQFVSLAREGDRFYTILPVAFAQPAGPLPIIVAVADMNGDLAVQELVEVHVQGSDFPVEPVQIDPALSRLLDPEVVAEDRAVRESVQRVRSPERLWEGYFHEPTQGVLTSTFGLLRSYNGADPTDYHSGLDFAAPRGTEVVAANAGIVAWTGETERRGRGVIIDHGHGVFSSYWHLASVDATPGTPVAPGTLIGRVGNTGLSTGSHLHWEITVYGVPVDPLPWLRELEVPNPLARFDPARAVNAGPAATP